MSSSRVDHGPFSDVLKDMLSKEFGHLNLASNISKVSLCLTTLIYRFSSLRGDFLLQILTTEHPAMSSDPL